MIITCIKFRINANSIGDSTAKITRAVSLLTILPPMYVTFNPSLLREPEPDPASTLKGQKSKDRKEQLRFLLFTLLVVIHLSVPGQNDEDICNPCNDDCFKG